MTKPSNPSIPDLDQAKVRDWLVLLAGNCSLAEVQRSYLRIEKRLEILDEMGKSIEALFAGGFIETGTNDHSEWAYELRNRLMPIARAINKWKETQYG